LGSGSSGNGGGTSSGGGGGGIPSGSGGGGAGVEVIAMLGIAGTAIPMGMKGRGGTWVNWEPGGGGTIWGIIERCIIMGCG
jgi:hypothetical protein